MFPNDGRYARIIGDGSVVSHCRGRADGCVCLDDGYSPCFCWLACSTYAKSADNITCIACGSAIALRQPTASLTSPHNGGRYAPAYFTTPANTNDSAGSFTTTDRSGTFRLVRTNGTMSAYVKSPTNPDWRLVTSGSAPGSTVYGMGLWASADQFAHQDGSVAYDNFQLNSGALRCPDWWTDLAPDVS